MDSTDPTLRLHSLASFWWEHGALTEIHDSPSQVALETLINSFIIPLDKLNACARVCACDTLVSPLPTEELAVLLDWLGSTYRRDFSGASFDSRLRIQKAVYFLKQFGYPTAKSYSFGDYFYGPYSPILARDYYAIRTAGAKPTGGSPRPVPEEAQAFLKEAIGGGNDLLEAAATVHAFFARNQGATIGMAKSHLDQIKPRLSKHASEAFALLRQFALTRAAT